MAAAKGARQGGRDLSGRLGTGIGVIRARVRRPALSTRLRPAWLAVDVPGRRPVFNRAVRRKLVHAQVPSPRCQMAHSRSEEHTSELQSLRHLVCRLLLEKKKNYQRLVNRTAVNQDDSLYNTARVGH